MKKIQLLACLLVFPMVGSGVEIDLRGCWDTNLALANPHKGWYHHFPDNGLNKYSIGSDADLIQFPGMDHLYIRLAWAYLEPERGKYNWTVIDDLITKWTGHGLGIAFRISCKETSIERIEQQFATPKWVMEAGARGGYYRMGKEADSTAPWEPVFDDPVFLAALEDFLKAFASRYDGQPWLRYVDVGSIGDWGEGHCWAGSRKFYGFEARKKHLDLHLKYFKKSQLVASDDFVFEAGEERRRVHEYILANGISYRDDSILVDGYFAGTSSTFTVRSPELFADTYRKLPTVLELEHYGAVKKAGNWDARPDSSIAKHGGGKTGPEFLRQALGLLHATYIGYHGDAAEWLKDNPELTAELLNRCGYWYLPVSVSLPGQVEAGRTARVGIEWENRGVAPSYAPFEANFRLVGGREHDLASIAAGNRSWMPGEVSRSTYQLTLPPDIRPGKYSLRLKLHSPAANRAVLLAVKPSLVDSGGYFTLGEINVQ